MEIMGGIAGTCAALFVIVSLVIYRNWRYEQELDSLLWKVDFRDIQMNEYLNHESKTNRVSNLNISVKLKLIFSSVKIYNI